MREIKFRAWQDGKILEAVTLTMMLEFATETGLLFGNKGVEGLGKTDWSNLKFMQYTGLKDKNDVEIYEGDIVKENSISRTQVVYYCTDRAAYKLGHQGEKTQYDKANPFWPEMCEVIGNIYENPELLK